MDQPQGSCPICRKPFGDGDDVVTCPHCGAPYHRDCYTREGRCVFADKHGAGFEYRTSAPAGASPPPDGAFAGGLRCARCDTVNEPSNIFCKSCGVPLHQAGAKQAARQYGYPSLEGELSGIPRKDWAAYIGNAAPAYIYRLDQMQQRGRRLSFMFSAFLLNGFYFAYRKLWGWAAGALGLEMAVAALQMLFWAGQAGFNVIPGLPAQSLLMIYNVGSYVYLAAKMLMGIFALDLYRRHAVKKITHIREHYGSSPQYYQMLRRKGGVSVAAAVAAVALVFAFSAAMTLLLGADAISTVYSAVVQQML
jgi:hypothetical protein